jgi:hypothetical protein
MPYPASRETKTMNIYEEYVVKYLKRKSMTNRELRAALGKDVPELGVSKYGDGYIPDLDRALQKLRKQGDIEYIERQWTLSGSKVCPYCKGTGRIR